MPGTLGHLESIPHRCQEAECLTMNPALSVLLPVYQPRLDYLYSAIESILHQSFRDFELIIIEAPSTTRIDALLAKYGDARIQHHRFPAKPSLVNQLNFGLQLAQSEMIARMDADDWSHPERLKRQWDYLQEHPEISVLGTQICIMDDRDRPIGFRQYPTEPEQTAQLLSRYNTLAHPSVMYRKQHILEVGGYWYDRFPANEDYELWCRLAKRGYRLATFNEQLLRYRIHPHAMKSEKLKKILRGTRLVKRHYFTSAMSMADWSRYCAEGALLNLPGWMILQLFKRMNYRNEAPPCSVS
jgi:glycosyltransferase involved in cell wall biosynthesis